jgi:hypothetical protein
MKKEKKRKDEQSGCGEPLRVREQKVRRARIHEIKGDSERESPMYL